MRYKYGVTNSTQALRPSLRVWLGVSALGAGVCGAALAGAGFASADAPRDQAKNTSAAVTAVASSPPQSRKARATARFSKTTSQSSLPGAVYSLSNSSSYNLSVSQYYLPNGNLFRAPAVGTVIQAGSGAAFITSNGAQSFTVTLGSDATGNIYLQGGPQFAGGGINCNVGAITCGTAGSNQFFVVDFSG